MLKAIPSMTQQRGTIPAIWRFSSIISLCTIVAGCGASKVTQIKAPEYGGHLVRRLVIAPPDHLLVTDTTTLTDAIGSELAKRGYSIVDARAATAILAEHNVSPANALASQALAAFKQEGIDTVLSVSSFGSILGGSEIRHVKVDLTSTSNSATIGEIDWNNSWGGMPGSPMDAMMRKTPAQAAPEIAESVAKLLGSPGSVSGAAFSNFARVFDDQPGLAIDRIPTGRQPPGYWGLNTIRGREQALAPSISETEEEEREWRRSHFRLIYTINQDCVSRSSLDWRLLGERQRRWFYLSRSFARRRSYSSKRAAEQRDLKTTIRLRGVRERKRFPS